MEAGHVRVSPHLLEDAASSLGLDKLAPGIKHALDDGADHGGLAQYDKLEAVARDERDVLGRLHGAAFTHVEARCRHTDSLSNHLQALACASEITRASSAIDP